MTALDHNPPDPTLDGAGPPRTARRGALALLCSVSFVVIMDSQIVLLALPSMQRDLAMTATTAQWVLSAYLLCFGGLLLLSGRVGDLVGHRRMLWWGTAAFGVSSLACGLAPDGATLVAARAVQGVSAAVMAPAALAVLIATFAEPAARNRAVAVWGAVGGFGATGALLVGGGLTSAVGWRWIFLINVPITLVVVVLAPRLLADTGGRTGRRAPWRSLDVPGAVLLTGGLSAAIYAMANGPVDGWTHPLTLGLLIGAVLAIGAFALVERRAAAPLLPPAMLRSRLFVIGNLAVLTVGMAAWGFSLITSHYAQDVLGWSPLRFGLASLALTVAAVVGARVGQALLPRLGGYLIVLGATAALVGCMLLTGLSVPGGYLADLLAPLLFFGLGLGITTMAGSVAALRDVGEDDHGVASGVNTAAFQLGGALGSGIIAGFLVTGADPATATRGFVVGAGVCAAFAGLALLAALGLTGRAAARLRSTAS